MKILHVIASLDKSAGGPSRSVPQTCIELAKLGADITIVTAPSKNPVYIPAIKNLQVQFYSLKKLIIFAYSISKNSYDIIHLQHVWSPYIHIMAWFARIKGIPTVITPRGMLEPWIMQRNPWKKKLAMLLYQHKDLKKAKRIHTTCQEEKENVRKLGYSNQINIIPNGIDLSNIPEPKGWYGNKKMVFLSRIHEKKGIENLLEAWKKIDNNKWILEIAGEGDANYITSIEHKIKAEQIQNVSLVGGKYETEKWDFIKSADIFVLPTYSENFGIVVAEALAVGVPVITTHGTPWQELETEKCGWWIDLNVENLTHCLQEAIQTPFAKIKDMGKNGIALIIKKYDIKSVAKQVYSMYHEIINNR